MSKVIGRGRYATETYPEAGGAAAGGSGSPLSRQRFIDGDTAVVGGSGSALEPFATIGDFMAARGNASIADATANFVGWLMPTLAGYVVDIAFPPYASTELRADSISVSAGTVIDGNATWANVAGAFAATSAAVAIHNITITGSLTVTDDAGAPLSTLVYGADEVGQSGASLGSFVSNATTKLAAATFLNVTVGGIDVGTTADSAAVGLVQSTVIGAITAAQLTAIDSIISSATIGVGAGLALFKDCLFGAGSNPVLTAAGGSSFDGASWASFVEAGGTRGAGTTVLVTGGSSGALVEGAPLTSASTSVSLNGTGATAGFTGEDSGNHYTCSSATPTTVTLLTGGGELPGDTMLITKTNLGANVLAVVNGGTGAGTIGSIPTLARGFVLARFDGTNWVFVEGGSMLA